MVKLSRQATYIPNLCALSAKHCLLSSGQMVKFQSNLNVQKGNAVKKQNVIGSFLIFFMLIILLPNAACRQKKAEPSVWVARVGNRYITPDEFRMFYQLDPNFGLDSIGFAAVVGELQTMTDQILAVRKARRDGMLNDPVVQKAIAWEKRQAMLRAFYRKIIGSRIKISDQDLRNAYLQRNEAVHVRHLFTKNKKQAEQWYKALKSGKASFATLAASAFKDSVLRRNGGDLGWVKISELDRDFARGLDTLHPGRISKPVKTHWGYHIIQLIDCRRPAIVRESDFAKQKPGLVQWLRRKKGLRLSRRYVKETIGKLNPQPDARLFMIIWKTITGTDDPEHLKSEHLLALDDRSLKRIEKQLRPYLNQPFIHYKGGHITLGNFIKAMYEVPLSQRPEFRTPHELSLQVARWFRDMFLYEQAKKAGMADDPQVKKEVRRFEEEQLYYYYVNQIADTLRVPDYVLHYFKSKNPRQQVNNLKHFNTLQEWKWSRAQRILHDSLKKLPEKVEVNLPLLQKESRNIDWQGNVRMFMVRKPS